MIKGNYKITVEDINEDSEKQYDLRISKMWLLSLRENKNISLATRKKYEKPEVTVQVKRFNFRQPEPFRLKLKHEWFGSVPIYNAHDEFRISIKEQPKETKEEKFQRLMKEYED